MKKSTKIIATFGVVAGLGIAALPLTSYAVNSDDVTLTVTVGTGIQMSVDSTSVSTTLNSGEFDESMTTTATVATNNQSGYNITVIDADENNALVSDTYTIPAASGSLAAGTAGWGIKGGDQDAYVAVPVSTGTPLTMVSKDAATAGENTTFTYGVATANDQHAGTYTDTIVFTATTNE